MPLGPMGCAIQVHQALHRWHTWAEHALDGWFLQLSDEHYQCHVIFIHKTRSEMISNMAFFEHRYITQPTLTPDDFVVQAFVDIYQTLEKKKNRSIKDQAHALQKLDAVFNDSAKKEGNTH